MHLRPNPMLSDPIRQALRAIVRFYDGLSQELWRGAKPDQRAWQEQERCGQARRPPYTGAFGGGSLRVREPRPEPMREGVGQWKPG